jgi:large subunit ribosomal protein L25
MQKVAITSTIREKRGKGPARQLRMAGRVPAVLYSKGNSTLYSLNPKEIDKMLQTPSGENSLITLQSGEEGNQDSRLAILKALQRDPIRGQILHVDLFEISINEKLTLRVPVEAYGVSVGVKNGGILQHNLRDIEIRCLPSLIPDNIRVDITLLKLGESLHVKDISVLEGVEIISDPEFVVVSVAAPMSEAQLEAMLATAPKDTKGPEVTGEKAKEEEGKTDAKGKPDAKGKGKEEPKAKGKEGAKK